MLRVLYVLCLAFILSFPASSKSNPPPLNSQTEQIRQLQADHDNLIVQTKGLTDLEKRVDDVHQYVAGLGHDITLFGFLLTILIIFISFRVAREAKIEAHQAAEDEVRKWIDEQNDIAIKPLQERANEILKVIQEKADQLYQQVAATGDESRKILADLKTSQGRETGQKDESELKCIHQKPESQYSFDDWHALYIEATNRKALDEVNKCVEGMESSATDAWQNVSAKIGRAWLLCEDQQHTKAVKLYDQIIDEYSADDDSRLIERVAAALFGKGYALNRQGQWKDAITVYDDLVSRYGDRSETGLAEQVASALFNKGYTLGQQGQWENVIATCDDLVSRYGTHNDAGIVKNVATALFNRAVILHGLKRISEAKVAYTTFIERYASRTESEILAFVEDAKKKINELGNV